MKVYDFIFTNESQQELKENRIVEMPGFLVFLLALLIITKLLSFAPGLLQQISKKASLA